MVYLRTVTYPSSGVKQLRWSRPTRYH